MKIVVFGPERRTGALHDGHVVDLCGAVRQIRLRAARRAAADIAWPRRWCRPTWRASSKAGTRALDNARKAIEYLFNQALDHRDRRGTVLVHPAAETKLHAPRPERRPHRLRRRQFRRPRRRHGRKDAAQAVRRATPHAQLRANGIWGFWKVHRACVGPDGEHGLSAEGAIGSITRASWRSCSASAAPTSNRKRASDYIWGVTLLGDWSIREPAASRPARYRFAMGKNFDGSCSLGPCIAVDEADAFRHRCRDLRQRRAPPILQYARHGVLVRRIPGILVGRLHALSRRHHQRRHRRRHRRRIRARCCRTAPRRPTAT